MQRLVTLATLILFSSCPILGAQTPERALEPLALSSAIDEALANNASLRAARAGVDAAGASAASARAANFPRISFTESWQRGDQPVFVFSTLLASRRFAASNFAIDQLNHPDPIGYFHATAGIEQIVFDGGARGASVDTARAQQEIAGLSMRETTLTLGADITNIYGQLLAAQAESVAALAAVAAGREDLARAERRRDVGVTTEADVLALRVHVADMEQRAIRADGSAVVLRAQMNRLTGAPVDRAFRAVEPDTPAGAELPPVTDLVAEAERERPEIQRAAVAEQVAENDRRAAKSPLLPKVAAQAAFDVSGTRFNDRASAWLVGGEFRWSLSTGGGERAQMKAAAAGAVRARAEAEDIRAQVQVEIVTALEQIRSARARQAVGLTAVAQARESERIIRDRYQAGLLSINDVLRAAGAVLDADTQRVTALVDEITGQARLNRAVGRMR